ncbi:YggS family pyridoxal phosphate-dependent enzyme [uncultured Clostridium sp.]|uniref:YggS family pyridoxal phosphate-dependent enzyme n=1 Tax=uncultured Clostridium sp. TaxID=59620 RepID=UPI0037DD2CF5
MTITENIKEVYKGIRDDVTVIAVSKTKPLEDIKEAYNSGVRNFGENKVQELIYKMDNFPHTDVNWHLLGHLQRNKVKYIAGRVNLIHSLDSVKLLEEIQRQYEKQEKIAEVLIQINIGREESKTGIFIEDLENMLENCGKCNNVMVKGLMAIIPIGDEESCRKYFKDMRKIFDKLKEKKYKNVEMKYLSMGMSADYKAAIEEGANMVRIGEGIFGKRDYSI